MASINIRLIMIAMGVCVVIGTCHIFSTLFSLTTSGSNTIQDDRFANGAPENATTIQDDRFANSAPENAPHINRSTAILNGFPITRFTSHILEILTRMTPHTVDKCPIQFTLEVGRPYSIPTFKKGGYEAWREIIGHAFDSKHHPDRILPGNVSLGFSIHDMDMAEHPQKNWACLASSSPNGIFAFINFLEVKIQATRAELPMVQPWEDRSSVPVWRGTGHCTNLGGLSKGTTNKLDFILSKCIRCQAVLFSANHPTLLDARLHGSLGAIFNEQYRDLIQNDAAVQNSSLLQLHKIPSTDYYSKYQVALVLAGIGAAFRTASHLRTETAVVLQAFKYEEWFTHLMEPWKHYIPLDAELRNLSQTMEWIQGNPTEVREIAKRGHQFYLDYLSFDRNEEHLYELVYRLALQLQDKSV
jgi:hypothetical protein